MTDPTAARRYLRACLATRGGAALVATDVDAVAGPAADTDAAAGRGARRCGLTAAAAQGLADLLPTLLCGEASAERVFDEAAAQMKARRDAAFAAALRAIAADEGRHERWLEALRRRLPPPQSRVVARRAARFLRGLASPDLACHLSRVAALDAGVCLVLAAVTARGTPLAAEAEIADIFTRIRRDEGRHVRISRRAAAVLGYAAEAAAAERRAVLDGFADLLAPQAAAFAAIGVDYALLRQRFLHVGSARSIAA